MKTAGFIALLVFCLCLTAKAESGRHERTNVSHQQRTRLLPDQQRSKVSLNGLSVESFENAFPPAGWSRITNFVDNKSGFGWQQVLSGDDVAGFQSPAPANVPPGGGNAVAFASWATGDEDGDLSTGQPTEQLLITPQIANIDSASMLRFYLRYFSQFSDSLDVLISTTVNSDVAAFNILVAQINFSGPANNDWQLYEYMLKDFVPMNSDIYIAFREHVQNTSLEGDALLLDLVEVTSLVTSVEKPSAQPLHFALDQNYPNPFNPSTNISFELARQSTVALRVYNLLGQPVATIVENEPYSAGQHLVRFNASHLPNGIYYYQLKAGKFVATRKFALLK